MAVGLTIDGQSLDIEGAWKHNRSLRRLRSTASSRGENRIIPGTAGTTAYPVLRDEVVVDLELIVSGSNDRLGAPYASLVAGLDSNLDYLDDWMRAHMDGSAATYTASLETANGTTYTTPVQILNWQVAAEHGTQVVMSYDLRIPSGTWT